MDLLEWLILAAVGATVIAVLVNWDKLTNWFSNNTTSESSYGLIIKEALENGNHNVIQGVINHSNEVTAAVKWENVRLDSNLQNQFNSGNILKVSLR